MRLRCPSCRNDFELPEGSLSPTGEELHCPACDEAFVAYPSGLTKRLGSSTPTGGTPSPRPGAHPGSPTPVGPSGGAGSGARTALPRRARIDFEPGEVLFDQWRLERELGRGGFGVVFEATELHLDKRLAVKVLDPKMVENPDLLARFRREVGVMRELVHRRIVRVFDYRERVDDALALFSMELVQGCSLRELKERAKSEGRKLPVPQVLTLLQQILEALAAAHAQGVIHRDVSPGNILLGGGSAEELLSDPDRDPQVKLVDFGIAGLLERTELSAKSRALGTAAYVAPEVLDLAVDITPAVDVYGAGAVAYELLTGTLPLGRFREPSSYRPELPKEANDLVLKLLETSPTDRPEAGRTANGVADLATRSREAVAETARRQADEERRRKEDEERRRIEAERQAKAERDRRAERDRLAEEAHRSREAASTPARAHPSMGAVSTKPARRGRSPLAWIGSLALVAAVVGGIGWGVAERRQAERQRIAMEVRQQEEEAAAAAEARRQEEARQAELAKEAEANRLAEEMRNADAAAEQARQAEAARKGEEEKRARERAANPAGIEWVRIVGGSFTMGCTSGDGECASDEKPPHRVSVRSFELAATETTVGQFERFVAATGHRTTAERQGTGWAVDSSGSWGVRRGVSWRAPGFSQDASHPVVLVSHEDATAFCSWAGGRLPSEAEWEYAARGGRDGRRYVWGNESVPTVGGRKQANVADESAKRKFPGWSVFAGYDDGTVYTSPAGSFAPNLYGLYDMAGNVWEWVEDTWHDDYDGAPSDGSAWTSGGNSSRHVLRGGSWGHSPRYLRVSYRYFNTPDLRFDVIVLFGFRCAGMGN